MPLKIHLTDFLSESPRESHRNCFRYLLSRQIKLSVERSIRLEYYSRCRTFSMLFSFVPVLFIRNSRKQKAKPLFDLLFLALQFSFSCGIWCDWVCIFGCDKRPHCWNIWRKLFDFRQRWYLLSILKWLQSSCFNALRHLRLQSK